MRDRTGWRQVTTAAGLAETVMMDAATMPDAAALLDPATLLDAAALFDAASMLEAQPRVLDEATDCAGRNRAVGRSRTGSRLQILPWGL